MERSFLPRDIFLDFFEARLEDIKTGSAIFSLKCQLNDKKKKTVARAIIFLCF